jgi:VIT1/CCC1 family predicted Fe2+/Mn2+ transporter
MGTLDGDSIRQSLREERASEYLYSCLEAVETGRAAELFRDLHGESAKQAEIWERELLRAGQTARPWQPNWRVRVVGRLVRLLGPRAMLPVLSAMKVRGLAIYRGVPASAVTQPPSGPEAPARVAEESWHRAASGGGALRAAVFGVNDGLVSNASLIMGVAGAGPEPQMVVLAGVAGLVAGAFAMASGEYISVRTQRELLEHQIALERDEILTMPEEEIEELALIYRAKGLDAPEAATLARRIVLDPVRGLDTLAREELGLDPQALASPMVAAVASFVAFAIGALVPLLPYLLTRGRPALVGAMGATEAGLLVVGGVMSLFTGRSLVWSALRMALLGSAAAGLTFAVGRFLGVSAS